MKVSKKFIGPIPCGFCRYFYNVGTLGRYVHEYKYSVRKEKKSMHIMTVKGCKKKEYEVFNVLKTDIFIV